MKTISNYHQRATGIIAAVSMVLFLPCLSLDAQEEIQPYQMPRGIPAPDWGGFDPLNATPPARPAAWPSTAVPGFYFVKASDPAATDTGNPQGTPALPRKTIPATLAAGSYVEVADCATATGLSGVKGTAASPVWIVGSGEAKIQPRDTTSAVYLGDCEYVIVNGLNFDGTGTPTDKASSAWAVGSNCHHIAIRHCTIRNQPAPDFNPTRFTSGGAGAWYSGLSSIVPREGPVSNIVVFGCDYTGNAGGQTLDYESGRHCIIASGKSDGSHIAENIWILNNIMHDNPEDGIQLGESSNSANRSLCRNLFIGGNQITNHGENAIDLKACERVITSQNLISGYRRTSYRPGSVSGSDGTACVLNNDGGGPFETWWLFNTITDSRVAWRNQSGGGDHYFIGNLVTDLKISEGEGAPTSAGKSQGVAYWQNSGANAYFVMNTIHNVHGGIYLFNVNKSALEGNIIHDIVDHTRGWPVNINNSTELLIFANLSYDPDGPIRRDAVSDTDFPDVNPQFVGTEFLKPADFMLKSTSPLLGRKVSLAPYEQAYLLAWGTAINLGFDQSQQAPGASIELPAVIPGPKPPTGLRVNPER